MADDTDTEDTANTLGAVAKGANSYLAANQANQQMQSAYDQMLANLQARMGDYDALGKAGYKDITAQQTGPSALGNIPQDAQARGAQQEAMAALSELAAHGGLSLADMQALNQIQQNLSRNNAARSNSLANQYAARGQLGGGQQLAMELANNQNATMAANQAGESQAAQAQQRALDAIMQKGQMGRQMGQDEYQRQANAARANDLIEARNAAARTDASKYNNSLAGQNFEDQLSKARGKTALTDSLNRTVFGKGSQNANTTLGYGSAGNNMIGGISQGVARLGKGGSGGGSGGSSSTDTPTNSYYDKEAGPEYDPNGEGMGGGDSSQSLDTSSAGDFTLPDEEGYG